MEVTAGETVAVLEPTHVAAARRRATALASQIRLDEGTTARVALVVTELATNLIKHGSGGELFVGPAVSGRTMGIQMMSLDKGRGIANVCESLRDGVSTAGSPGTGLGAIRRASNTFDVYSAPQQGSVLAATVYADRGETSVAGGISVPVAGEHECGDGWAAWAAGQLTSIFLCDGLGHGADAAHATRVAVKAFLRHAERPAADVIRYVYDALKPTRGGAVAVAALDHREGRIVFCGLGNISGTIIHNSGDVQHMVSHNGIAGHTMRTLQEFSYSWPRGSLAVLHSDGLVSSWSLSGYAGLDRRQPDVIAGVLYRDYRRGRDDATVVVARNGALS
jgi:anti-sigma regulatory factor (Ser/Thr protein kinase)